MAELTHSTTGPGPGSKKSLVAHMESMQHDVYIVESLVSVIVACGNNPQRVNLTIQAAEAAQEILLSLGRGLDSVELAKVLS